MKHTYQQDVQLVAENLTIYNTTISFNDSLPKFITDKKGRLFQKTKTLLGVEQSKATYSEVEVVALSSVEVVTRAIDV